MDLISRTIFALDYLSPILDRKMPILGAFVLPNIIHTKQNRLDPRDRHRRHAFRVAILHLVGVPMCKNNPCMVLQIP